VPCPDDWISPDKRAVAHFAGSKSPPRPRIAEGPSLKVSQNAGTLKLQFADERNDAEVVTVMLANADADPPLPAHVRVYVEFAVGETVSEPLTVCVPLQLPDAEQLVALVELHVSVEDWPAVIDVGVAVRVTEGVGVDAVVTVTLADPVLDPPAPVQVRL
jgi:hypothetical protein